MMYKQKRATPTHYKRFPNSVSYSGTAPISLSISSLLVAKQFFVFFVPARSLQVEIKLPRPHSRQTQGDDLVAVGVIWLWARYGCGHTAE